MAATRPVRRLVPALVGVVAVLAAAHASAGAVSPAPLPRVTVIGDSVASAIAYDRQARTILAQGVDLRLELTPCRRLAQESCPYDGARPPTVLDLVASLGGALGPTVVVAVGYNDFEQAYADDIEQVLDSLHRAGVTRVLWLTLRAQRHSYLNMNDMIAAAAARHPEMTVVDWNLYSRSHPDWFQDDGLHLGGDGADAMATLVHDTLAELGIAVAPAPSSLPHRLGVTSARLPAARLGSRYVARLRAAGGTGPYRWSRAAGALPVGVRLLVDGRLVGVPRRTGRYTLVVRVVDAHRASATRRVALSVRA